MILFCIVHTGNINARPLRDGEFITEMDALKGLELPGDRYRTVHSHKDFTQAIADVERQKIIDWFNKSSCVAIIVDGSIDSAVVDNEIVFIQTCTAAEIHTDFLRYCQVQCGNAEGIINAIKRATSSLTIWDKFHQKLVALGSDGASVMTDKKSGVITFLQGDKPSVIGVHCCGHRLELAYKDTILKNPFAEKITTLLPGLHYFYRNSALNRTNLTNAYTCLGMKVLLPTQAGGTRWDSHVHKALEHFLNGYKTF